MRAQHGVHPLHVLQAVQTTDVPVPAPGQQDGLVADLQHAAAAAHQGVGGGAASRVVAQRIAHRTRFVDGDDIRAPGEARQQRPALQVVDRDRVHYDIFRAGRSLVLWVMVVMVRQGPWADTVGAQMHQRQKVDLAPSRVVSPSR